MSKFIVLAIQNDQGEWHRHSCYTTQAQAEAVGNGLFDNPSIYAARIYDSRKTVRDNLWLFSKPLPNVGN